MIPHRPLNPEPHSAPDSDRDSPGSDQPNPPSSPPPVAALPSILMRTSQDITSALQTLYRSHGFLEQAAIQRLSGTRSRLADVSSTTESAAHRILDRLDKALLLIDEVGSSEAGSGRTEELQTELREEVHGLITSLQFQDIVAQQIAFAVHVLEDTELRIHRVAEQLEQVFGKAETAEDVNEGEQAFDPGASATGSPERQSVADTIFSGARDEDD